MKTRTSSDGEVMMVFYWELIGITKVVWPFLIATYIVPWPFKIMALPIGLCLLGVLYSD